MDIGESAGISALGIVLVREVFQFLRSRNGNGIQSTLTKILVGVENNQTRIVDLLGNIKEVNDASYDKVSAVESKLDIAMERQQVAYKKL